MYFVQLSIPPNTTIADPASYELEFAPGICRRVRVVHPTGCVDLVGVWINYRNSRLYPLNDDGFFLGNGSPLEFTPNSPLIEPPFVLDIMGYNLDDTYTHKPTVALEIEFMGSLAERERGFIGGLVGSLSSGVQSLS